MDKLHIIRTGIFGVNTIIVPFGNKKCFVVDPAACSLSHDETKITDYIYSKKLECTGIILTHSHFDHITGITPIKKVFPKAKIAIHEAEYNELQNPPGPMGTSVIQFFGALELLSEVAKQPNAEIALSDNQTLECVGCSDWNVIHTPGHTPGSICLYNQKDNILISGDTLFDYGGYGRTDMAGGDETAIIHSLNLLRKKIPSGTAVYPGHDSFGFTI